MRAARSPSAGQTGSRGLTVNRTIGVCAAGSSGRRSCSGRDTRTRTATKLSTIVALTSSGGKSFQRADGHEQADHRSDSEQPERNPAERDRPGDAANRPQHRRAADSAPMISWPCVPMLKIPARNAKATNRYHQYRRLAYRRRKLCVSGDQPSAKGSPSAPRNSRLTT